MSKNTEARRVHAVLAKLPQSRGRRFTSQLRADVERYARRRAAEGASKAAIARELGVSGPTITRALKRPTRALVPVRVVSEPVSPVVVRGPCGVVVEGLDVAQVAKLMRELA